MIECPYCDHTENDMSGLESHALDEHEDEMFQSHFGGFELTCYCDNCGDDFLRTKSQISNSQFCSIECTGEYQKGTPRYGKKFESAKKKSMAESGYKCVDCGLTNKVHKEIYSAKLTAHHINRVSEFDDPQDAHTVENLVTVCKQCHRIRHCREWEL